MGMAGTSQLSDAEGGGPLLDLRGHEGAEQHDVLALVDGDDRVHGGVQDATQARLAAGHPGVAFDALGLPAVSEVLRQLLLWLPNVVVALVVLPQLVGQLWFSRGTSSHDASRRAALRQLEHDAHPLAREAASGTSFEKRETDRMAARLRDIKTDAAVADFVDEVANLLGYLPLGLLVATLLLLGGFPFHIALRGLALLCRRYPGVPVVERGVLGRRDERGAPRPR